MNRTRRIIASLVLIWSAGLLSALPVFAQENTDSACCLCVHRGEEAKGNTCLTVPKDEGGANCFNLSSVNAKLNDYICNSPASPELKCTPKSSSASGICDAGPVDIKAFVPKTVLSQTTFLTTPELGISIPGLTFANFSNTADGKDSIPFLAQYISAVYSYITGVAAIAAAIMILYGGFLMILSQTGAKVRQGREIITDAIVGLVLILGAYIILDAVNPSLTKPGALRVQTINKILYDDKEAVRKESIAIATVPDVSTDQIPIVDIDPAAINTISSPSSTGTVEEPTTPDGPPGTVAKDDKGNLIAQGACPSGMVSIISSKSGSLGSVPSFCIDEFEAPNIEGKLPYSAINEWEADWDCNQRGKRLCSLSEWQRACVGPQGTNLYGYGPKFIVGAYVSAEIPNTATVKATHNPPAPCNYDTNGYEPLPPTLNLKFASLLLQLKKPEYSVLNANNPWATDPALKTDFLRFQTSRVASSFAEPSGKRPCVTQEGVHDMNGNLQEIVLTDAGATKTLDQRIAMGSVNGQAKPYRWAGFYWSPISHLADTSATPKCTNIWGTDHSVNERAFENGYRCCMNLRL
ncbi:MAG: pilin [Patescibacteria group bacterium]